MALPLASTSGRALARMEAARSTSLLLSGRLGLFQLHGQPDIDPVLVVVRPTRPDQFLGRFESVLGGIRRLS